MSDHYLPAIDFGTVRKNAVMFGFGVSLYMQVADRSDYADFDYTLRFAPLPNFIIKIKSYSYYIFPVL
jgi:hypothetical protein